MRSDKPFVWLAMAAAALLTAWVILDICRPFPLSRREPHQAEAPADTPQRPRWVSLLHGVFLAWIALVLAVALFSSQGAVKALLIIAAVVIGLLIAPLLLRIVLSGVALAAYRFSAQRRITDQAERGDIPGAIAAMHALIERKGRTSDRLNSLGLCYQMGKDHERARETFAEALKYADAGMAPAVRNNLAMALRDLGRLDEAEDILRQLCEEAPNELIYLTSHCAVLAKLGRWDEAASVLRKAEEARSRLVRVGQSSRRAYDDILEECRQLLAGRPAAEQ